MKPSCTCLTTAVEYAGWYGTVHEFIFSSRTYVNLFAAANVRKTISDIRQTSGGDTYATYSLHQGSGAGRFIIGSAGLVALVFVFLAVFYNLVQELRHDRRQTPDAAKASGGTAALHASGYRRYDNSRFGFSILYPREFLPGREPDNGDGLSFKSPDGRSVLVVSGINEIDQSVADELAQAIASVKGTVTYRRLTPTWFVISWQGSNSNEIGYRKTFVGSNSQNTFEFVYPTDQKMRYDAVLVKIARSFRPGDLTRAW